MPGLKENKSRLADQKVAKTIASELPVMDEKFLAQIADSPFIKEKNRRAVEILNGLKEPLNL